MLTLFVPEARNFTDLVLDFNGTLACDGRLIDGVPQRLRRLAGDLVIHVVTGDTFGTAGQALSGLPCAVHPLPQTGQALAKLDYVHGLGAASVVCIGNGRNDVLMMQAAGLGIAVMQAEGASPQTLMAAQVAVPTIGDALDLMLNPLRLKATLRT